MNNNTFKLLEFDKIKEKVADFALTSEAKKKILEIYPSNNIAKIEKLLSETSEGRKIIDVNNSIPISNLDGIVNITKKLLKNIILQPKELMSIADMLENVQRLKSFMVKMVDVGETISSYAFSMYEINDLNDKIRKCISYDMVDDRASKELNRIRKRKNIVELRIKDKLNNIIVEGQKSEYLQELFVSEKNGKYVVPIKREHKNHFDGEVIGSSTKGSTVYIEPTAIKKVREELEYLRFEEEREVYKILSELTGIVEKYKKEIMINIEAMIEYDFIFAKAKYSKSINGIEAIINSDGKTILNNAVHPLLEENPVPLNYKMGENYRALLITGPNTGGKTVSIKTVGLLTLMTQSGFHISCDENSEISVFNKIYVDIGDGQSIEQSLSTFSSHMKNIAYMLKMVDRSSLIIIDELGAGTDPIEGMGLAVSILKQLYKNGATILATTHYSEIKSFANIENGFENGCMEFNIETLKPMYKLSIGRPGESNALIIGYKLGLPLNVVEEAHFISYKVKKDYSNIKINKYITEDHNNTSVKFNEIKYEKNKEKENRVNRRIENNKDIKIKDLESSTKFKTGDLVHVEFMGKKGVVCEEENSKGEIVIIIMKKKYKINKKRVKKYIDREKLYPDSYDMDIVLESKENRKKKNKMLKKHTVDLVIERNKEF